MNKRSENEKIKLQANLELLQKEIEAMNADYDKEKDYAKKLQAQIGELKNENNDYKFKLKAKEEEVRLFEAEIEKMRNN